MKPKQRETFLNALHDGRTVKAAAARGGHSESTFYRLRKRDLKFQSMWDEALEAGHQKRADELEAIAEKRARQGDSTLLIFLLKSLRPERFCDRLRLSRGTERPTLRLEDVEGYEELCNGLLECLQPYPDALRAVIAMLDDIKKRREPEARRLN